MSEEEPVFLEALKRLDEEMCISFVERARAEGASEEYIKFILENRFNPKEEE